MKKEFLWILLLILVSTLAIKLVPTIQIIINTNPPPVYTVKSLEEQIECAKKAGLPPIKRPILRIMKPPIDPNKPSGSAYHFNFIVLSPYTSYSILGHELGHIIDFQTNRHGSPVFETLKDLPEQEFADSIRNIILHECNKSQYEQY